MHGSATDSAGAGTDAIGRLRPGSIAVARGILVALAAAAAVLASMLRR